jgi:hypothetical protein
VFQKFGEDPKRSGDFALLLANRNITKTAAMQLAPEEKLSVYCAKRKVCLVVAIYAGNSVADVLYCRTLSFIFVTPRRTPPIYSW